MVGVRLGWDCTWPGRKKYTSRVICASGLTCYFPSKLHVAMVSSPVHVVIMRGSHFQILWSQFAAD